jgi:hypothetical protein
MDLFRQIKQFFIDYVYCNCKLFFRVFPETPFMDNSYYQILKNIRNYTILTPEEIDYIHTLSKPQLLEIIIIYDLHTQIIRPIILENY